MIVTIFCGDLPAKLRKRFPGEKVVSFNSTRGDVASIRKALDGSPLTLIGYSAGCHGVRELLDAFPWRNVIAVDGTHASLPQRPQTMPIGPWRKLADRARAGELLFIASHTYNTYTEALPAASGPFRSTVGVLRELTGAELPMPDDGKSPTVTRYGAGFVVASYRSTSCDKPAHAAQIQQAAEYLCALALVEDESASLAALPSRVGAFVAAYAGSIARMLLAASQGDTLGTALLAESRYSLAEGVREGHAKNAGDTIDRWLAEVGASSPNNWCAASVAHWLRKAAGLLAVKAPIAGSAGAKATMAQFVAAGRWLPANTPPARLRPGMVPVWHRGAPGAWTGHIGVLESVAGPVFVTIEGNSGPNGDRVARMTRRFDDPNLLGFGWVD